MIISLILIPFLATFILSLLITAATIKIYTRMRLLDRSTTEDHPKHIHTYPVPRGGGIPVFFSMLLATFLLFQFNPQITAIFLGAALLLVLGVWDDVKNINPYFRLGMGLLAAVIVVASGIGIDFVSNPFSQGVIHLDQLRFTFSLLGEHEISLLADILAVFWIVWGINFLNMGAKGIDGQLPGVVVIAAAVMGILGFRFIADITTWPSAFLAFSLAGAYAGLLVFNVYPQRIMPGWGGGTLAGYFMAVLAILSGAKVATALIVLGVPLMDVVYAIIRRIRSGRSPVWGDNFHLHHRLLALGWSKRKVAYFYWLLTAFLGLIALSLNSQAKAYTIVLIGVVIGGLFVWINYLTSSKPSVSASG